MDWTAEIVGRMHNAKVRGIDLAAEAGIAPAYLSAVLNGHKDSDIAKERILAAMARLEKANGVEPMASSDNPGAMVLSLWLHLTIRVQRKVMHLASDSSPRNKD